jgi:hypothetical protein
VIASTHRPFGAVRGRSPIWYELIDVD